MVRLTTIDLELMVQHLGLASVRDLKTQGLVTLVKEPLGPGQSVWRPRIRFRSRPLVQCPFLVNDIGTDGIYHGLCSLHPESKPLVCRLSPLTRDVDDSGSDPVAETWSFVPPVEGCPGVGHGELLPIRAPLDLRDRLDQEVADLRRWILESQACSDEESAWQLMAAGEGRQ